MTHTERLFQHTLPRWSGVTVLEIDEELGDMWIRGEQAQHHEGVPFDPEGIELLRRELRRDFTGAPSQDAFGDGGIVTVADLDDEMQRFDQRPLAADGAMLKAMLTPTEHKKLTARSESKKSKSRKSARQKRKNG